MRLTLWLLAIFTITFADKALEINHEFGDFELIIAGIAFSICVLQDTKELWPFLFHKGPAP